MFFLPYKHTCTDNGVVDDFPKISDHFPKIFQNCPEDQTNVPEHFPRISENFRRLSRKTQRCFDDTPTNLTTIYQETKLMSVKLSISSHVRISYRFYQSVTTRYITDFYVNHSSTP